MATPTVHPTRSVSASSTMLDDSTQPPMVPTAPETPEAPPAFPVPDAARPARSRRSPWWAAVLATVGLLTPLAALVANSWQVERWANAIGSADDVSSRLSFDGLPDGVTDDRSPGEILFVTVAGPRFNALQWMLSNWDHDLLVQDRETRFGRETPNQQREIALQMMRDAKDVAEYVAYRRLGFGGELKAGEVVVERIVCLNGKVDVDPACDQLSPAGQYLERGATITSVDGTPTPTLDALGPIMKFKRPGDVLTVTYRPPRSTEQRTAEIRTIPAPGEPTRALIGIVPHDTYSVELPFQAEIDTNRIGGPSAGLAFTLTLIDRLTPGSLTGGLKVAVTGTIQDDGSVGAIGGLHQKVVAVKQAGAKLFIIPAAQSPDEIADARRTAGDDLEVVTVTDLEEALRVLHARGGAAVPPAPSPTAG